MTDKAVLKYYEKKRLVIRRCNDRVMAEQRVRFLEYKFKTTIWYLERLEKETIEAQLGEAYMELMNLKRVKVR